MKANTAPKSLKNNDIFGAADCRIDRLTGHTRSKILIAFIGKIAISRPRMIINTENVVNKGDTGVGELLPDAMIGCIESCPVSTRNISDAAS